MKTDIIYPPFGPEFDLIISALYAGSLLQIKQSQPYASEFLVAGFLIRDLKGQIQGRAALYQNPSLYLEGKKVVTLGAYECVEDAAASAALLEAVLTFFHTHFPQSVLVGPMDGNSWQTYRFVSSGHEFGPFLLEPFALPYYKNQWIEAGLAPLMQYVSNLAFIDESHRSDHVLIQAEFEKEGLVFRNLDTQNPDVELLRMAKFNAIAFQSAFLFSAISDADFIEKNRRMMDFLDPALVHVVQDGDEICGMILAYPDKLDPSGNTAVVKTLARLPGERYRGLGDLLCVKIVSTLLDHGYGKMIHALMRADNASILSSSRFWGKPYKKYLLFTHIDP